MLERLFAWNDRRRARDTLQQFCDDRVAAIRALDQACRNADRALKDAQKLAAEQFRQSFFGRRDPVHAGFMEGSAKLFGITEPTRMVVEVPPIAAQTPRLVEAA